MRVTTNDGKYTVVQDETGRLHALRYGEAWRDCVGDGLIYTLAANLEDARIRVKKAEAACAEMREFIHAQSHTPRCHLNKPYPFSDKARAEYDTKGCDCGKDHALSSDCGKGYIPASELDKTIEFLAVRGFVSCSCSMYNQWHKADCPYRIEHDRLESLRKDQSK